MPLSSFESVIQTHICSGYSWLLCRVYLYVFLHEWISIFIACFVTYYNNNLWLADCKRKRNFKNKEIKKKELNGSKCDFCQYVSSQTYFLCAQEWFVAILTLKSIRHWLSEKMFTEFFGWNLWDYKIVNLNCDY